jgi:hypothetical protein
VALNPRQGKPGETQERDIPPLACRCTDNCSMMIFGTTRFILALTWLRTRAVIDR